MEIVKFDRDGNGQMLIPKEDLDSLLNRIEGVVDWAVGKQGEVAVEYDHGLINYGAIESDLSKMGFVFENIYEDDPLQVDQSVHTFIDE